MDSTVDHRLIERRSKRARRWFWAAIAGAMAVAFVMVAGLFTYCQFSVTALSQLCVDVCCGGATSPATLPAAARNAANPPSSPNELPRSAVVSVSSAPLRCRSLAHLGKSRRLGAAVPFAACF